LLKSGFIGMRYALLALVSVLLCACDGSSVAAKLDPCEKLEPEDLASYVRKTLDPLYGRNESIFLLGELRRAKTAVEIASQRAVECATFNANAPRIGMQPTEKTAHFERAHLFADIASSLNGLTADLYSSSSYMEYLLGIERSWKPSYERFLNAPEQPIK